MERSWKRWFPSLKSKVKISKSQGNLTDSTSGCVTSCDEEESEWTVVKLKAGATSTTTNTCKTESRSNILGSDDTRVFTSNQERSMSSGGRLAHFKQPLSSLGAKNYKGHAKSCSSLQACTAKLHNYQTSSNEDSKSRKCVDSVGAQEKLCETAQSKQTDQTSKLSIHKYTLPQGTSKGCTDANCQTPRLISQAFIRGQGAVELTLTKHAAEDNMGNTPPSRVSVQKRVPVVSNALHTENKQHAKHSSKTDCHIDGIPAKTHLDFTKNDFLSSPTNSCDIHLDNNKNVEELSVSHGNHEEKHRIVHRSGLSVGVNEEANLCSQAVTRKGMETHANYTGISGSQVQLAVERRSKCGVGHANSSYRHSAIGIARLSGLGHMQTCPESAKHEVCHSKSSTHIPQFRDLQSSGEFDSTGDRCEIAKKVAICNSFDSSNANSVASSCVSPDHDMGQSSDNKPLQLAQSRASLDSDSEHEELVEKYGNSYFASSVWKSLDSILQDNTSEYEPDLDKPKVYRKSRRKPSLHKSKSSGFLNATRDRNSDPTTQQDFKVQEPCSPRIKLLPQDFLTVSDAQNVSMATNASFLMPVSLADKLRLAASRGQMDKVKELMADGASTEPDREGRTALHYAALNGYGDIVQLLANEGCDIDSRDNLGYTALHRASAQGHLEVIKFLLAEGCIIDRQDHVHGNAALHEASWNGYSKTLEILVKNNASVQVINKAGFSSLHLAAQNGHNQSARVLLYAGCNLNHKNNYGDTPLHTAARYGHAGVTRIFISAHCRISEPNKNGDTALHIAAALKRRKIAKLLTEAGIDVSVRNKQNEMAADVARRKEYPEIILIITSQPKVKKKKVPTATLR